MGKKNYMDVEDLTVGGFRIDGGVSVPRLRFAPTGFRTDGGFSVQVTGFSICASFS